MEIYQTPQPNTPARLASRIFPGKPHARFIPAHSIALCPTLPAPHGHRVGVFALAPNPESYFLRTVSKHRRIALYWTPVILWMGLIFLASSDQHSADHSSRIVDPIVKWFFPGISHAGLDKAGFIARKIAHVTVYGVLATLLWLAFVGTYDPVHGRWTWRPVLWTMGLIVLYASFDEIHQTMVPTRQGTHWDVVIDTSGACLGMFLTWAVGKWRQKW